MPVNIILIGLFRVIINPFERVNIRKFFRKSFFLVKNTSLYLFVFDSLKWLNSPLLGLFLFVFARLFQTNRDRIGSLGRVADKERIVALFELPCVRCFVPIGQIVYVKF